MIFGDYFYYGWLHPLQPTLFKNLKAKILIDKIQIPNIRHIQTYHDTSFMHRIVNKYTNKIHTKLPHNFVYIYIKILQRRLQPTAT